MSHVFISYQQANYDFAMLFTRHLQDNGFQVWIDDASLRAGENWRQEIEDAIRAAFAVVVVMSPAARTSEYVTYEWATALGMGIAVIPVLLEKTELHPRLDVLHYLDFTAARNRPWDRLVVRLKELERQHEQGTLTASQRARREHSALAVPAPSGSLLLRRGCNNVSPTVSESAAAFAARITPATAVVALWEHQPGSAIADPTGGGYLGWTPFVGSPNDLRQVTRLRPVFVCVSADAVLDQPPG